MTPGSDPDAVGCCRTILGKYRRILDEEMIHGDPESFLSRVRASGGVLATGSA